MKVLEGDTLGEILKTVRKDWGRKTPGYLSQKRMAAILERKHGKYAPSQGSISNIENDLNPLDDLHEEIRYDLLRLYPLTHKQIAELDRRFGLRLSGTAVPDVKNATPQKLFELGKMDNIVLRVLGNPATKGYTVSRYVLDEKQVCLKKAFVLETTGRTLLCPELRAKYQDPFRLLFNEAAEPVVGQPAAYKVKGQELYVITAHHPDAPPHPMVVKNYDDTHSLVLYPDDPTLEYLGAAFGAHQVF